MPKNTWPKFGPEVFCFSLFQPKDQKLFVEAVFLGKSLMIRKSKTFALPSQQRIRNKKVSSKATQQTSRRQVSSFLGKTNQAGVTRRGVYLWPRNDQSNAKTRLWREFVSRVPSVRKVSQRTASFLCSCSLSVDILTVHVSLTAADWLDGWDHGKVTGVKWWVLISISGYSKIKYSIY